MKTKIILQSAMCAAVLGLAASASAQVPLNSILLGHGSISAIPQANAVTLVATGTGDVTVSASFLSQDAGDDDQLFLYAVNGGGTVNLHSGLSLGGAGPYIFDNKLSPINGTVDLGSFSAGDELVFELKDVSNGKNWFSGSASPTDSDGKVHFDVASTVVNAGVPTSTVGVEDATDFDYNDLVFSFTGVSARNVPDAAGTMSLLGLGMTGLTLIGRRFRK